MKLHIKYMVSIRCKMIVKSELEKLGIAYNAIDLGEVEVKEDLDGEKREQLNRALLKYGLELMDDKRAVLIEKIKDEIVEMVHHTDESSPVKNSEYLSEKLDYDYTQLASLFSEATGITLEQYIIIHKIERVKELLLYDGLNLTEIAFKLNYSSVSHLSAQFKKITGLTPTFFKQLKNKRRNILKEV